MDGAGRVAFSWEIPCIAHFCSLFRLYFDLIDFDIEELEEALLTDSVEEVASSLLQDLIVQLLKGCFNSKHDEITTSNYQEGSTKDNPFETDAAFHSLPVSIKVKILYDLCDFRLDNEDVPLKLESLESDSLRVEPLGRDSGGSTYWYFYGTRLYREDYGSDKSAAGRKRGRKELHWEKSLSKWQVVCYTEEDWQVLTRKFKNCKSIHEKNLHRTLSSDFLPELPRLFAEKERLQRKRMLEQQLRRSGRSVLSEPNQHHHHQQQREDMPVQQSHKKTKHASSEGGGEEGRESVSESGDMEEDELRRQREEQEKADRLLAEEIEREERKARLHLRERRGGGVPPSQPVSSVPTRISNNDKSSSSRSGSSSNRKKNIRGSRSSSATSKSPSKSPAKSTLTKNGSKKKTSPESKRTTNNSLSTIQSAVLSKGAKKYNKEDDDSDDGRGDERSDVEEDDDDDNPRDPSSDREEPAEDEKGDEGSTSRSSSPAPVKKSTKKVSTKAKQKSSSTDKEKRSKSKDKLKDKDRKKRKMKKEKSKDKDRDRQKQASKSKPTTEKALFDTNHAPPIHSMLGMSKAKVKSSVLFSQSEEDVQIGMHKVVESIKNHGDAWPFMNPVDEDYAPNYYKAISSPMDLQTMEDKLDNQEYVSLEEFIADFQRIVDNCIKYNGPSSEYTEMAETLQDAFHKSVQRYIAPDESDDEEISIEYSNMGSEKKRPRTHSTNNKKDEKSSEHKKENQSSTDKKQSSSKSKQSKSSSSEKKNKVDKKSKKHKLMRHHSRDSEAIENLDTATAETLKDIDKWLVETPKPTEYVSSGAAAFDNLRNRILEDDNDRDKHSPPKNSSPTNIIGHKRKLEENSPTATSRPQPFVKSKEAKRRDYNDEKDEDFTPPKKMPKKSDKPSPKDKSKSEKSKQKKSMTTTGNVKLKKNSDKQKHHSSSSKTGKDKRSSQHHHSSKHQRHSSGSGSSSKQRDSTSPPPVRPPYSKSNGPNNKVKKRTDSIIKDDYSSTTTSPGDNNSVTESKPSLKHSKSFEDKKHKSPVKRTNSLFTTLKGPGSIKKLQPLNKGNKLNSVESKFNKIAGQSDIFGGKGTPSGGGEVNSEKLVRGDNNSVGEKPEKKKCLLLNDAPTDRKGGPKLSLGTVLSTDAIKLGGFKKNEYEDDEDATPPSQYSTSTSGAGKVESSNNETAAATTATGSSEVPVKVEGSKASPQGSSKEEEDKEENDDEEEETDRKLEPSKGFKPEKCMPNLSAWIKAFGGPTKPVPGCVATAPVSNSPHGRKPDNDPKSFKVMGRGVGESNNSSSFSNNDSYKNAGHHKHSPVPKGVRKQQQQQHVLHPEQPPHWNSNSSTHAQQQQQQQQHKPPGEPHPTVLNEPQRELSSSSNKTHNNQQHKKHHRHRKMSTSSLSSQSESGSPHPFSNQDGPGVNPPRWVDEHWAHSQSQSPSASSQVSSQSPANSPFSPAINSPPHTPQTPPRPVGPVRVGFYQDITSQHSSPEKINEPHSNSNSNVASPSTPPTPTNNHSTNASRGGGGGREMSSTGSSNKNIGGGFGPYNAPQIYTPRYAASTPSPNVGPGSNMQSPSPGGMTSVESPPAGPNSPHSPNVPEYRPPSYSQSSNSQHTTSVLNISATTIRPGPSVVVPAHSSSAAHHRTSSLIHHGGSHSPAPSIPPYPPPTNHYGHPSSVGQPHPEAAHSTPAISQAHQPVMAHMNQVQAHSQMSHQQHYERYPPHNYHHQMNSPSSMPPSSLPSSASSYTQNLTAAHSHSQRPSTAQPSPYPSNPYASNPRNINIPPNVYTNPMSADSAMSRFYKSSVSSGELSLTSSGGGHSSSADQHTTSTSNNSSSSSSSSSRGRNSRSNAAAAAAANEQQQQEIQRRETAANLEGKLGHSELNGFVQWPHNLASLSQIVNSIPNPMNAVGMANAYRQYQDQQAMAESMSKYQRAADPSGYSSASGVSGGTKTGNPLNPPAAHSQPADKLPSDIDTPVVTSVTNSRRQGSKAESKSSSRSQSNSKSSGQAMVAASAFNFSSLSPADLALYPSKDEGSLYSASPPSLAHRPDLYPSSTSSFHTSFSPSSRSTAGGVPAPSISPYQIPPFIGSHPSPYQSQSSQPFAHSQPPRGLVDPYQQFFQSSPHVMGLLPPTGYPYPHGLGFNRPGWI
ncbi:mucin-12 isoform X2 [Folsomia candida]|uniref:mucin-12 isoform X2 n=1 Tax=Folsomia candida TaxID=158441 RepID=UPI0016050957|nr:mucin-12 isoform X2 [Folsomia candida]